MGKSHNTHQNQHIHKAPSGRTNLASCIVATVFLIFLIIVASIIYLTLFKPRDPKLKVNAIQLPAFSTTSNNSTVNFTFSQYATVNNPNRAVFTHYDSSLQLLYSGNQVGFMFIPAGKIGPGKTQYMAATFSVKSFPFTTGPGQNMVGPGQNMVGPGQNMVGPDGGGYYRMGPGMELESKLEMAGRVRVLGFFTHHVVAKADCRVAVSVSDGSVLGFHC